MADLFISYSRDDLDVAEKIALSMQKRGLSVWWDTRLIPTDVFPQEILNEIKKSHAVLVLWSESSRKSRWVTDEAKLALDLNKLVQVSLDNEKAPPGFGGEALEHVGNLSDWDHTRYSDQFQGVVDAIERLIPPRELFEYLPKKISQIEQRLARDKAQLTPVRMLSIGSAILGTLAMLVAAYIGFEHHKENSSRNVTEWTKIYENDSQGRSVFGNYDELVDIVRKGADIKVAYSKGGSEGYTTCSYVFVTVPANDFVVCENTDAISVKGLSPEQFGFIDDAYHWYVLFSTSGQMAMSRWSVGEHIDKNQNIDNVNVIWFAK